MKLPDKTFLRIATVMLLTVSTVVAPMAASAHPAPQQSATKGQRSKNSPAKGKTTPSKGNSAKGTTPAKGSGKSAAPAKGTGKSATPAKGTGKGGKKAAPAKQETSADVKKRQEATRKEIKLTEEQIRENERQVRTGLSELGKLGEDINASKKQIACNLYTSDAADQ